MGQLAGTQFSPRGTIGKRDFWIGFAVAMGCLILSGVVDAVTEGASNRVGGLLLALVLQLVGIVIWFMIAIKRCRALGQSPWLSLLLFIPIVGLIWLIVIGVQNAREAGPKVEAGTKPLQEAPVLHTSAFAVALSVVVSLVLAVLALHLCVGVVSRYVFAAPVQLLPPATFERAATYGFIAILVCGALAVAMVDRNRNARRERTGLWLALPVGIGLAVLATVGLGVSMGSARLPELAWSLTQSALASYAFVGIALMLFAISVLARTPRMATCLALPVVLTPLAALAVEVSTTRAIIWLLPPLAIMAGLALVVGLATSRCIEAVWLAIGVGMTAASAILLSLGLFTPTELAALVFAGVTFVVAILLLTGERQRIAAGLVSATGNVAALVAAVLAILAAAQLWTFSGAGAALAETLLQSSILAQPLTAHLIPTVVALIVAVLAYLATPLIGLVVLSLSFGALVGVGISNDVAILAVVLGALAGFIVHLYTSATSADGEPRPVGLVILAVVSLALGVAAPVLAPIGTFLARMLLY